MRSAHLFRWLAALLIAIGAARPACSADTTDAVGIQEEIWALPLPQPMSAYLVRPSGDGPFPLVIMNGAHERLVEATAAFGRTSRVRMLWIYIENDTFFGPDLSKRMHAAFTAAGGRAEYHLMPPFGNEGHFFIGSPDAIPLWSPLVAKFLDEQR